MYNETARKYLKAGLNPIPLEAGSMVPSIKKWGFPIDNIDDYDFEEIGICTGAVSGGVEVVDLDIDVLDDPEAAWEKWKSLVPVSILEKLTVAQTKSGGYHVIYRTNIVEGNQKLASTSNKETIIETRGQGGYIKCFPSKGYTIVYGSLENINLIEDFERSTLLSTSRLFDEKIKEKKRLYADGEYEDPFPDYNADPDIGLDLLEEDGWTVLRQDDDWVYLQRPGKRRVGVSASYNLEKNFLYVFSTSSELDPEKPYSNSSLYCELRAEGNYKRGYMELRKAGYGAERKGEEEELEDLSFLSKDGEDEDKLYQAIKGEIPVGLSFGWPDLDPYYVYKENTLNFILAFEGVGKTWMVLHKLVALAVLYGKKFALCCGENEVFDTKQTLIEAISGKNIEYFKDRENELRKWKDIINAHFFIFKNEVHYSVEDVLERVSRLKEIYEIDGAFIDPFSYFKKPLRDQYAYSDDLLSKLNIYAKKECTLFMSLHPVTDATRAPRNGEGYLDPPSHYHATGGNMFANRTDHFLVYHRVINHKVPALRRMMEIRSCKVKSQRTGGSVTPANESTSLTYKTFDGFTGYFDSNNRNPIYETLHKNGNFKEEQKPLPKMKPSNDIF